MWFLSALARYYDACRAMLLGGVSFLAIVGIEAALGHSALSDICSLSCGAGGEASDEFADFSWPAAGDGMA